MMKVQNTKSVEQFRERIALSIARIVAHEINNIFTGIIGFAQLVEEDQFYLSELLKIIKEQGRRGVELIKDFQKFVHRKPEGEKELNLKEKLEKLASLFQRNFIKNQIQLNINLPDLTIFADWFYLETLLGMLFYLISNLSQLKLDISAKELENDLEIELSFFLPQPDLPKDYFEDLFILENIIKEKARFGLISTESLDQEQGKTYSFYLRIPLPAQKLAQASSV